MVVSDHSPCSPNLKRGGFDRAWGGIASLELRLPIMWTEARERGFGVTDVIRWTASAPAEFGGIPAGAIEPGRRADLVVWDPNAERVVDASTLFQRHPVTPYAGRILQGAISATLVRGRMVFGDGKVVAGTGNLLERE
jgi:allantoinase